MNRTSPRNYFHPGTLPFWGTHLAAIVTLALVSFSWSGVLWTATVYLLGMFFVTGGYHRYFSHRSYKTSRVFQFILAWGAQMTCQKGALWWAGNHRHHHKCSDEPDDLHSPREHGFWWSHIGWLLSPHHRETQWHLVKDLAKYPELRLLNHRAFHFVPGISYLAIAYAVAGTAGLAYGVFLPLVLIFHGTFLINSLCHVIGRRRYDTSDDSKNSLILALITLGEGWHNNHHHYQRSVRQGFRWYEVDVTYYVLWLLARVGIVWELHTAPAHVAEGVANPKRRRLLARDPA